MEEQTVVYDYTEQFKNILQHLENIELVLLYVLALNTILFAAMIILIFFVAKGDYSK